jgi:hypothetical protein
LQYLTFVISSEEHTVQPSSRIAHQRLKIPVGTKLLLLLLGMSLCGSRASSQVVIKDIGRTAPVSARTAALGDAYIADATDAGDVYGNPATLPFLPSASLFASHSNELMDEIMGENIAVSLLLGNSSGVGLGMSVTHTGYVKDSPRTTVKMRMIQYALDLAYAQRVSASLGMGFDLGVQNTRSENFELTEFVPSLGLFYAPSPEVSYGIAYRAHGSPLEYSYDSTSTTWRTEDQRQSIEGGVTLRLLLWRKDPTVTLALANEKLLHVKGIIYKGGIEFIPVKLFAVRLGYFVTPDVVYARYGVGLNLRPLRIDYSISPSYRSNRFHEITAALNL